MTSTLAFRSPAAFTDTTLPRFPLESVTGTLLLVEPYRSDISGVPATGSALPDLAGKLSGAGAVLRYSGMNGTNGLIERSTKGGIHALTHPTLGASCTVQPNEAVLQYILDNIGHKFYFSTWYRITRASTVAQEAHFALSFSATGGATELLLWSQQGQLREPATFTEYINDPTGSLVSTPVPKAVFAAGAITGYTGTIAKTAAQVISANYGPLFTVGNSGPFRGTTTGFRSAIFYRACIEDLTVSGRTIEDMEAADHALFQEQVLTAGGRYYGDSYTNPSTLS